MHGFWYHHMTEIAFTKSQLNMIVRDKTARSHERAVLVDDFVRTMARDTLALLKRL